jgi:G3E family GTPase
MTVPVSIITGFLGSGKTTLLRHLLADGLGGRRVALIVNEIGEVGFDGRAVEGLNVERIIELTSGCICCTLGSDFLLAVEELIDGYAPDLIVIETTGLAEPSGLARQVRAAGLPLDSIVTLADAAHLAAALDLAAVARWQLRAADIVVLDKIDLATPVGLVAAREAVREHNQRAMVIETVRGVLNWQQLFGFGRDQVPEIDEAAVSTEHLRHDGLAALLWRSDTPLIRERLDATLHELPTALFRLKGHVYCSDAPWPSLVHYVCGRVDYETTRFKHPPNHLNELVLIGALEPLADELRARLDACAEESERAAAWLQRLRAES